MPKNLPKHILMNDLEEKIFAIRDKGKKVEETPVEQPVETQEAVPTDEPKQEEPQAEIVETPEATESPEPEKEEVQASWDDTPEEEVSTPSSQIDYSELGSALELGEIKTKEDFITKASELKSKLKLLEDKPLEGIPEELREVIEVAKTGDWKEHLASQLIDFSKLDPIEEFERDFITRAQNNPKYFTDGKFDPQKVEEALETMPEAVRETYGNQLLSAKVDQQRRQREAITAKAQAKRQEAEKTLATATKNLGEILPLETYGIKFEPKHSSEIYNGIVNSKLTKKHMGMSYEDLVRTGADMKAVTRTITLAEKGEKMIAHKASQSKVAAQKDILKKTTNVQLNTPGTNISPEDPEQKVKSPVDKMKEFLAQTRKGL